MSSPMPPAGAITPNPPVNVGGAEGLARPYPCDAPGTMTAGWRKTDAPTTGGWDRIDDVDGGEDAGWCQT